MKHHHTLYSSNIWMVLYFLVPLFLFTQCADETGVKPGDTLCSGPKFDFKGKIVSSDGYSLYVLEGGLTQQIQSKEDDKTRTHPRWSPDGRYIAYDLEIQTDSTNEWGLKIRKHVISIIFPDGSIFKTIEPEFQNFGYLFPSWSPKADQIAYCQQEEEGISIHIVSLDLTEEKVIAHLNGKAQGLDWSPDGSQFGVITENALTHDTLSILDKQGTILRASRIWVSKAYRSSGDLRWSPDGTKILYPTFCYPDDCVMIMDAQLSGSKRIIENGFFAAWSPDGSQIVCASRDLVGAGLGSWGAYCWYLCTMELNGQGKKKIYDGYKKYLDWTES